MPTRACLWYSTGIDIHIFSTGACRHDRDFAHHYPYKISLQNTKLLCIYSVVIWHMYKPFSSVKDLWRSLLSLLHLITSSCQVFVGYKTNHWNLVDKACMVQISKYWLCVLYQISWSKNKSLQYSLDKTTETFTLKQNKLKALKLQYLQYTYEVFQLLLFQQDHSKFLLHCYLPRNWSKEQREEVDPRKQKKSPWPWPSDCTSMPPCNKSTTNTMSN